MYFSDNTDWGKRLNKFIGCDMPHAVDNSIILGNRYGMDSILKYECTSEYELKDDSNSQITCQDNGHWTESHTQCLRKHITILIVY